ncbi:MAG: hypothetical protein MJE12_09550, partial [Alphaproteobacteria bacterium]|nr:hypothetical protein [Alphaproteobacteria bacterium]
KQIEQRQVDQRSNHEGELESPAVLPDIGEDAFWNRSSPSFRAAGGRAFGWRPLLTAAENS